MDWIEVMGLPGAGKTTLLSNLTKTAKCKNRKWFGENEVRAGIINNFKSGNLELAEKLSLAKFEHKRLSVDGELRELMISHVQGLEQLKIPGSIQEKSELFFIHLISRISRYNQLKLSKPIFLDEGILHNYFGKKEVFRNMIGGESQLLVLYLKAEVKDVLKDLQETKDYEARGLDNYNENAVKEVLLTHQYYTEKKVSWLKEWGVKMISFDRVDLQDEANLKEIASFIDENI